MFSFIRAYIKSMRLYYAFVTGIAGWIGVSFYQFNNPGDSFSFRKILILVMLFLSWGINQIINDYLGLAEDRINAPHRPMVTGRLPPGPAMGLSFVLLGFVAIVSWILNPWALAPLVAGVLLNVLYEYAKGWSLWGNLVFGMSISMCTVYGFLASGPAADPLISGNRLYGLALVVVFNGLMTYYTYFKDYDGDKAAGKRTFIVRHGINTARYTGAVATILTCLLLAAVILLSRRDILSMKYFQFCAAITIFLQLWNSWLFFKNPKGERTYFSLATNIRACVAGQVTIIAIYNGTLALILMSASYIFIGFLFELHKDAKA
ncbi:MAG: UbiA family prenyltransferase [Bacteroidetes bacterium]|nr:UbiA family prenyltransferase [Bacteroidota bacterium]